MDTLTQLLDVAVVDTTANTVAQPVPQTGLVVTGTAPVVPVDPHTEDLNNDVDYARKQLKSLIDDARSAINGALELATAGSEARPYEVVATLIQSAVQANKELIVVHETRKKTLKTDKEAQKVDGGTTINIDKAVFAGRASDLLRELHEVKKQQAADAALSNHP
jgi:hypothetical protein